MSKPTTVNEVANAIADAIEKNGHLTSDDSYSDAYDMHNQKGKCCVLVNPVRIQVPDYNSWFRFRQAIGRRIGGRSVVAWSDNTPTEEVIATLRSLH